MLKIGYACLTVGVINHQYRTLQKKNLNQMRLYDVIRDNLATLERMLDYNFENGIQVFRITSDLIPFGSYENNRIPWEKDFLQDFIRLSKKIKKYQIRISFHPGQYTVLNSPRPQVVAAAKRDLIYHTKLLRLLGGDRTNKIVIHIGGVYGNKAEAIERFIETYQTLDPLIKEHIIIENDDKYYSAEDVAYISKRCNIPVVFDILHHRTLASFPELSIEQLMAKFAKTWDKADGRVKFHYSQQDPDKQPGAHSATIFLRYFLLDMVTVFNQDYDIMLEVKDKNLSALKCEHLVGASDRYNIKHLEREWSKYKYLVLEHSPRHYKEIREILKDKESYPVLRFYNAVEEALATEASPYALIDAANHVWGYFKIHATKKELAKYEALREEIMVDLTAPVRVKKYLFQLLKKYKNDYLDQCYYFFLDGFEKIAY